MSNDGVQRIIDEIGKSTEAAVSEVLSEAKQKADAVLQESQQKAGGEEREIVARGEQEARREAQRILAEARIQARKATIAAQEEVVKKTFDTALETLRSLAEQGSAESASYKTVLEGLIREAVVSAGVASLEVQVNPRDKGLLTQDVLSAIAAECGSELSMQVSLGLSDEPLSCLGGVVVRSADSKVRVDNTLESRIERFRDSIRTLVARELFNREQ
ncbi:MAG: hypothetical protein GY868_17820 [Deltaproteobacteria bacterium]|nr:hypothetical protein [Deltaproteobacteria bacterium]